MPAQDIEDGRSEFKQKPIAKRKTVEFIARLIEPTNLRYKSICPSLGKNARKNPSVMLFSDIQGE